jgi:acyl-CoA synthetase (AMP-forming)/AMP-acid ligase II
MIPHPTLVHAIRHHALMASPATVGVVEQTGYSDLTYPTYWSRVVRCAEQLQASGVRSGDRVAVDMSTSMDLLITIIAVMAVGAILVPLRGVARLRVGGRDHRQASAALSASEARWCLAPAATVPLYEQVTRLATVLALDNLAASEPPSTLDLPVELDPELPAIIQFSSGSTADPKGILITHHNLATNVAALADRMRWFEPPARGFSWLPFSHDMGLVGGFAGGMYAGAAYRAMSPHAFARDPLRWIRETSAFRASYSPMPPFACAWVIAKAQLGLNTVDSCDLSTLDAIIVGAERVHPNLCTRLEQLLAPIGLRRHTIVPAYGLAENCVAVALRAPMTPTTVGVFDRDEMTIGRLTPARAGSRHATLVGHGTPLPGTLVRIVSPTGEVLADGQVGEIQVGGESATDCFLDRDGRRRPARRDGFVPTGDLGALLAGELFVVGRLKEIFKYGGLTFAPADIEAAIMNAGPPGVTDAVVVGVQPGGETTESLLVFLEHTEPALDTACVDAVRMTLLREFQLPVREVFVAPRGAIPKTASGKFQRTRLAAAYLNGTIGFASVASPIPSGGK